MARQSARTVSESHPKIVIDRNVMIPMRDGTKLAADIYRPEVRGQFPVLIERTPYNKENSSEIQIESPQFFASHGYAVMIQDVRGRYASPGEFYPFRDDGWGANRDGYDTIEWAASQPWSDGNVGTIGGSYSGMTQYRLAPLRPPHLRAMFVRESSSDYHQEWVYRGGAFELAFCLNWALNGITLANLAHLASPEQHEEKKGQLEQAVAELSTWHSHLPLNPLPLFKGLSEWYHDWLAHPDDGPYWWQWNIAQKHHEIDTPIYHLGGWYDIFLRGTLENFKGIRARGMTEKARKAQKLIVGPWIHGPRNVNVSKTGDLDFGPEAAVDLNVLRLKWFDSRLKGIENGIMEEPPVRIFVMGENRWRDEDDWPLKRTQYTSYYLRSGQSRSIRSLNDGVLSPEPPSGAESPESFLYDPEKPLPTIGGNTLGIPGGPFNQRGVEEQSLTYTTPPLRRDTEVTGPITCTLYGMSSAPDTDLTVKLTDVYPDGSSFLVADGILRARYRDSLEHPTLLVPHKVYKFTIDLWSTSQLFKAGHRIRVSIGSSNFPRFDRNLNTGGEFGREAIGRTALNTVFHDYERSSHMTLPIIPRR